MVDELQRLNQRLEAILDTKEGATPPPHYEPPSLLKDILSANIRHITEKGWDVPFYFKPDTMVALTSYFKPHTQERTLLDEFLSATTPKDFLMRLVKAGLDYRRAKIDFYGYNSQHIMALRKLCTQVAPKQAERFLDEVVGPEVGVNEYFCRRLDQAEEATAKHTITKGLFCDVQGTLLNWKGELNSDVVKLLEAAHKKRINTTIFTGDRYPYKQEKELLKAGMPEELLKPAVQAKGDFRGQKLEMIIDDQPPEYQGFGYKHYLRPDDKNLLTSAEPILENIKPKFVDLTIKGKRYTGSSQCP